MPAINLPNQHFDVLTWSGTGGSSGATRSITGLNFQPDLIWEKARTSGTNHQLLDSVRGVGQNKVLASNSTGAEPNPANTESLYGWLSSLDSGGFTVTNGTSTFDNWNKSGDTYVGWTWKAGGTAVTNTSGTISSQVSANPTAGFSVVTYTGTGVAATIGHGLGVAPSMAIIKRRSTSGSNWLVYHVSMTATSALYLNTTEAKQTFSDIWNNTAPTSTVMSLGTTDNCNLNGGTYVGYFFAAVAGYSTFGSYTGNGSTDGPFIYTGFRPRFLMLKKTSNSTNSNWLMQDTSRETYNASNYATLAANLTSLEPQVSAGSFEGNFIDYLSNGFKIRSSGSNSNESSSNYIYMAFAEAPFKFSNAR